MRMPSTSAGELAQSALMPQTRARSFYFQGRAWPCWVWSHSCVCIMKTHRGDWCEKQHPFQRSCLLLCSASAKHNWVIPVLSGRELQNCLTNCHGFHEGPAQPSLGEVPTELPCSGLSHTADSAALVCSLFPFPHGCLNCCIDFIHMESKAHCFTYRSKKMH